MEIGRRLAKVLSEHSQQASFAVFPDEISTFGLSNLLQNSTLPSDDAKEIAKFFDDLDQYAEKMMKDFSEEEKPKTFIGKELSLSKKSDYSMILSGMTLPSGKKGVVGLIGPKSMKYEKNLSLMEYISKLLGGSAIILVFFLIK
jgi:transcriptional regulator of heat shock response